MKTFGILMLVSYVGLAFYLKPPGMRPIDIFKVNTNLLPYWIKFPAVIWIIFVVIHAYLINKIEWTQNYFLLVGVNLGLLILVFSKDKVEDEFSAQIRWKSMYLSIISLFVFAGFGGTLKVLAADLSPDNSFAVIFTMLNAVLMINIIYYYSTKYRSRRAK